jgi:predicted branched-subunit amino acid permease
MKYQLQSRYTFFDGIRHGLPICFAYLAVSFTFGLIAVKGGLNVWTATLISATNLTSAGQFAGLNMILLGSGLFELFIAVFVINSRYMLMSLSLSQQLPARTGTFSRLLMSCFVTDEIFALANLAGRQLTVAYFLGLGLTPYIGWSLGTFLGGCINAALPQALQAAMGIALYCMFIAIIVPPAKKSQPITFCIIAAILLSCILEYVPWFKPISYGFKAVISSVIAAGLMARFFPIDVVSEDAELSSDESPSAKGVSNQ